MNINSSLIIQIIVFGLLVWFTMSFVWPPITKALDERAKKIAEGLSAADKAKLELSEANKRVETQLVETREEATRRLADADRRGQDIVEEAKRRAEEEAQKIIAQARSDAELQLTQAKEALRSQVAELAIKGAEQILRKEVNAQAHTEMLEHLKAEL